MTAVIPFVPSFCRENGEMLQYWYLKKAKKIVTTQILEIQSMHLQMESDLKKVGKLTLIQLGPFNCFYLTSRLEMSSRMGQSNHLIFLDLKPKRCQAKPDELTQEVSNI